jgi:hypothetical protein
MSQSTPINLLRRGGEQNQEGNSNIESLPNFSMNSSDSPIMQNNNEFVNPSESQLVEDILKEMGDSPGMEQQSNINSQALQYTMDSSQVPAYKQNENNEVLQPINQYNNYSEKMVNEQEKLNTGMFSQMGINLNSESIKDKFMKNIKYPILVFIISFIISLPEFNRFLFGFFPRLLLESGQVSIGGVLIKSVVAMLLFIIVALFL